MVGLEAMLKLLVSVSEYNSAQVLKVAQLLQIRTKQNDTRKTNVKFKNYESTSVANFDTLIPAKTFPI